MERTKLPGTEGESAEVEKLDRSIRRREKGVKRYQFFLLRMLLLLLTVWLLFFVFIGVTHMPNGDMYPRVDAGDFVVYYRLDKSPKFQDVVVYQMADSSGKSSLLISRVIAVPGDTVELTESGTLKVNGNAIAEPGIFYPNTLFRGQTAPSYPLTLGEDEYFVLGDKRDGASDSRSFGPVPGKNLLGTVITILRRTKL